MTVAEFPPVPPPERQSGRYAKIRRASEITPCKQRWLIPSMIPLGTMTVFAGSGGEGKSTMMLDIASRLSRGDLDGDIQEPGATLILSVEDSWDTVMLPRLMAARANLDQVIEFQVESYEAGTGETFEMKAEMPLDVNTIASIVAENNVKLIVFDPALSFMTGDPHKAVDVRRSFDPISTMAQRFDIAVLLIAHFNKGGGSVAASLSGSHAWRDLTRSYWGFAKDDETGKRVFSQDKGNYSKDTGASYEFDIVDTPVEIAGEIVGLGAVGNVQKTDVTVGDLLVRDNDSEEMSEKQECQEWLLDLLNKEPFEKLRSEIVKAAKSEGFSTSTLKRAKSSAGVWHSTTKTFPKTTIWAHPCTSPQREPTEPTGGNVDVSPGQNSQLTVGSPNETWSNCGPTDLTRDDTRNNDSGLSGTTAEGGVQALPIPGVCQDCGRPLNAIWGKQPCDCEKRETA